LFFLASVCSILSSMGGNVNLGNLGGCWTLKQPPKASHGTQKKLHKMIPAIVSLLPSCCAKCAARRAGVPLHLFIFPLAISPKTNTSSSPRCVAAGSSFQAVSQPCNRSLSVLSLRLRLTILCFFKLPNQLRQR
jgi:hypothetical protein